MMTKKIPFFLIFIILFNCAEYQKNKISKINNKIYYSSTGFALIYEDSLYNDKIINKKINGEHLLLLHSTLKKNTPVRITNLINSKFIELKVYKKANYPKIFNVLITKKIANTLDLDVENPLIEILELKKNKKFVAKEGNTFEEEKNVADKAPVDEIVMNNITELKKKDKKEISKKDKFIIIISDFYYEDSAIKLKNDLIKKISLNKTMVKKISNNKYRLLVGPFENFNALKTTYISLNNLGFESLNIYNE